MGVSAPSLHRESTDSLIRSIQSQKTMQHFLYKAYYIRGCCTVFSSHTTGAILLLEILNDTIPESNTPASVCVILSDDMEGLRREVTITAAVIPVTAGSV